MQVKDFVRAALIPCISLNSSKRPVCLAYIHMLILRAGRKVFVGQVLEYRGNFETSWSSAVASPARKMHIEAGRNFSKHDVPAAFSSIAFSCADDTLS